MIGTFITVIFQSLWLISALGLAVFTILEWYEARTKFRKEKIDLYEECADLSLALMWIFLFLSIVTIMNR